MISPGIELSMSMVAFDGMCRKLVEETKLDPIGLVLGTLAAKNIGDILGENRHWGGLRVDVLTAMPADVWILYNGVDFIVQGDCGLVDG